MLTLSALIAAALTAGSCSPSLSVSKKQPIDRAAMVGTKKFKPAVAKVTKSSWVQGNHVTSLVNGKGFFPAMIKASEGAKKSITFETYAFVDGKITRKFVDIFCRKAQAGVHVHMVLDAAGSRLVGENNLTKLRKAGVDVKMHRPISLTRPVFSNYRDHRKIMVVDGKIGFIGGSGVAQAWTGDAQDANHWRENHYMVTGPVVAQLQKGFLDNWKKTGGAKLTGDAYFPTLTATGKMSASAFISAPVDKKFTVPHFYRQVISAAKKSIVIENAYVLLDRPLMQEILAARKRGVHVEIIMPGNANDAWMLRYLSRFQYNTLLNAGAHLYEYQGTMMHCKVMVIDGVFSSIGSANFDPRSLYINDESNLNVFDKEFAAEQLRIIAKDKKRCVRITTAPSPWNPLTMPSRAGVGLFFSQL